MTLVRRLRPNLQHRILYSLFLANSHISNSDDLLAPFTRRRRCILHVFSNARCCRCHREVFPVSIFHRRRRRRRRPFLLSFAAHAALPHEPDQMHVAHVAPFRRRNRRSIDILRGPDHFVRCFRKPHRFFSSSVVVRVVMSASPSSRRRRGKVCVLLTHRLSVLARSFRGLPGKPALVVSVTTSRTQTAAAIVVVVVPVFRSRVDQDGRDGAPRVPVHAADVDLSVKKVPHAKSNRGERRKKGQKKRERAREETLSLSLSLCSLSQQKRALRAPTTTTTATTTTKGTTTTTRRRPPLSDFFCGGEKGVEEFSLSIFRRRFGRTLFRLGLSSPQKQNKKAFPPARAPTRELTHDERARFYAKESAIITRSFFVCFWSRE